MRKRILALLMALVMVFGLNTTVLAAPGDSPTGDNTQEIQTIDVQWMKDESGKNTWNVKMEFPENEEGWYMFQCELQDQDGTVAWKNSYFHSSDVIDGYITLDMSSDISESGEYVVFVNVLKEVETENGFSYVRVAGGASERVTYTHPGKELAVPANVNFASDGKITFDTVEGADLYTVSINYYGYNGDGGTWTQFTVYAKEGAKTVTLDYVNDYMDLWDIANDANYTVQVRAMSADINVTQHSDFSEESNMYKHKAITKDVTVTWDASNPTEVKIKNVADGNPDVDYYIDIYKDGKWVGDDWLYEETTEDVVFDISDALTNYGPGEYEIVTTVNSYGENSYVYKNELIINYNPTNKLVTPNATLSDDGIITFDLVDGAEYYILYYCEEYLGTDYVYMFPWATLYPEAGDTKGEFDINPFLESIDEDAIAESSEDFDIKFGVIAITSDISKIASSDTTWITVIEHRVTQEQVKEKLDELLADEDATALEVKNVLEVVSNDTLVELMKDTTFVEKIKTVEANYVKEMNINVIAPKSDVATIDATKISVVGAALNADAYADVQLTVAKPAQEVKVPDGYRAGVQLDINLMIDGESLEELTVPVTITMPIPAGVETKNLVILHYHGDATEPAIITPVVNADGTMTFTVTGFSTFVITNSNASPATADTSVATVCAIMLFAAAAVVVMRKRNVVK